MAKKQRTIHIDPVSRVEGHARISIIFGRDGSVADARLHVTEFRGFESFCRGRLIWEMPALTSRICGVCPVSHAVTSAMAGDAILAVTIPETAELLRRVLVLAQWVQSHALSFFHLSSPDLLLGAASPPKDRSIFGVAEQNPEFALRGIRIRKWSQEIINRIAGRRIHADYVIPGGVRRSLDPRDREIILDGLPEAHSTTRMAIDFMKAYIETHSDAMEIEGNFPSLFLGHVAADGSLEYYGGEIRVVDSTGNIVADRLAPGSYRDFIGETVEDWSYLSFPYYSPLGPEKGMYRVGPLARLNLCSQTGSPKSDRELTEFRQLAGNRGAVLHSWHYHYARLIEILFALERIEELLANPEILRSDTLRSRAFSNRPQGVGSSEAPRGALFHNYSVGQDGVVTHADLMIATSQNNLAMNRSIRQIATQLIDGPASAVTDAILNRIEMGIRSYDPCFSCSTHALGRMPIRIDFRDSDGRILDSFGR